uniref:Very-long-chain (3R)-3-hydroxyacyl-CoA dehydratase n=1 Tax=Globodera rostochiensis TaxID=31243 RepID=A0A914H0L5_GLORO
MKSGDLYLLAYNTVQYFGWGSILVSTALGLANGRTFPELYENVELQLKIFQTAAILEIVHSLVGLVRSPVFTTLVQVFSRVTVLWLILDTVETSRASVGVPMLLLAWSITEVVRYSFYALNLLNSVPYALTWMRYTFFIALYPMGAGGEVLTMIAALDEIARRKHFTIEMPNSWNMSFNFYYVVIALCLIYLPGFPKLYGYMFVQRKKVLGGRGKNATEQSKKVE